MGILIFCFSLKKTEGLVSINSPKSTLKAEAMIYVDVSKPTMRLGQLKSYWKKSGLKTPLTMTLEFPRVDLK
jgi:hypothetical protein